MRGSDDRAVAPAASAAAGGGSADAATALDRALDQMTSAVDTLAGLDVTSLPEGLVAAAVTRLGRLDGRIDGLQARLVAAAEAAGVPERSGATSTASWLAEATGRSGGQAARTDRLARASEAAPALGDALARGDIGPDQAATLASALDRDELDADDAEDLLPAARRLSPGMFTRRARQVAGSRRQERLRRQELEARDARYLTTHRTDDGSLAFEGLVPPAEGDRLEKALAAFHEPDPAEVPEGQRRTHRQRRADALAAMADAALASGASGDIAGTRPHISVVVSAEAMAALRDAEEAGATATTDLGTVLSAAAFKRLACDATFRRTVIDPEGQPLDVGRATRAWPPAVRAAVAAVDGGCRGPGCDLPPHRTELHHVTWWRNGGATGVDNAAPLCGRHHDIIHDDGWGLDLDPATRVCTWTAPDGTVITTVPQGPGAPDAVRERGPRGGGTDTGHAAAVGSAVGSPPGSRRRQGDHPAKSSEPNRRGDPARPRAPGRQPSPSRPVVADPAQPLRLHV